MSTFRFLTLFAAFGAAALGQTCVTTRNIATAATVTGTLDATSCNLSDGTPEESFRLVLPRRGTLHAAITSKNPGFAALIRASDSSLIATGATIDQHMEAGIYTVVANTALPSQTGDYSLTTSFRPDAEDLCHYYPLTGVGSAIHYALSDASCVLPDSSRAETYRMTVYGSGTLTVTLDSSVFSPYLILRSEDGYPAAVSDAAGGNEASISIPVAGGQTYSIVVSGSTANAQGAFDLSTSFLPDDDVNCRASGAYTDTQDQTGSFDTTSCTFNLPGRDDAALFNYYDVTVPQAGVLNFQLNNATFTGYLLVVDSDGNTIAEDHGSGDGGIPFIQQQLPAGQYRVFVYNGDSFTGTYTLSYTFAAQNPGNCAVTNLASAQLVIGNLSARTSCRRASLMSDTYQISVPADGLVTIGISSGDFTTVIELHDTKDNLLVSGDQSTDGTSAQISTKLPAGLYTLVASSDDLAGGYTLSFTTSPATLPACNNPVNVPPNTGYISFFGLGNCTMPNGQQTDLYTFTLPSDGMTALVVTSSAIEGVLTLLDAKGNVLRWNQDGYIGSNPAIFQYLPAGTYNVQLRGAYPSTGKYRFDVLFNGIPTLPGCAATPLSLGASQAGVLGYSSCRYPDDTFAQWYQIVLPSAQSVQMQITSSSFVPGMILFDAKGNLVASGDAGGTATAILTADLAAGSYYLVSKASDDASANGNFAITLSPVPQP